MNRTTDKSIPVPDPMERDTGQTREEGLLRRWSRRKAQAREETPSLASAHARQSEETDSPEIPAPSVLTDADMPPIESLDQSSDYRPFMSPGVSEELRTHALRRMFHSGLFNELCPLEGEYYDCHGYEPLGSVITHEMRAEMERTASALKEKAKQALLDPEEKLPAAPTQSTTESAHDESASPSTPDSGAVKES
jgi:hypothetical protein